MNVQKKLPIIYIASPYTKGDVGLNVRFQGYIFNELLGSGLVWPIAPLLSHFQHVMFPRSYKDWIDYDNALLHLYDGCLRLNASYPALGYLETNSVGADNEVSVFRSLTKPVFFDLESLYEWAKQEAAK